MVLKHSRACSLAFSGFAASLVAATLAVAAVPAQADPPTPATAGYLAPYYTLGDLTGDGELSREDLDLLAGAVGTVDTDAAWAAVAPADYDGDGEITLTDVADLSLRLLYDDGPFELIEASAVDMQKAMNAGVITSVELTQAYLDRIAAYDHLQDDTHSRPLNSILATSDVALAAAAASDAARAANGGPSSMLDGIPILLKDNYDTEDMPTSAGCGCWEDNQTADDAFMVAGLRDAGAIILGKASLDEFAYGFVSEYSTGEPAGSTKLVASPYVLSRTAGGSSGGTGASIAANLGGIGFGTDTGGSIRVPSSYNQLVGIRPTVGLASRDGIVPLALSQDTGGPIARSVSDAAIALDAVTGIDPADPVTSDQAGLVPDSYTSFLADDSLEGAKIGYLTQMVSSNATTTRLFNAAVADLTAQGAEVVPITIDGISGTLGEGSGSTNEFKHDLDEYIAHHLDPDVTLRTLTDILASNRFVTSRRNTYNSRNNVSPETYATWMSNHTAVLQNGRTQVTAAMDDNDLDALIYPSTNPYSTYSTNMRLSPNTGLPAVTVPMGQATAEDNTILGAGVNLEFLGRAFDEGPLLGLAYDFEQATHHRTAPELYPALAPAAPSPAVAAASVGGGFTVTPSDTALQIGDTVEVTVAAEGVSDLYAYDLGVSFDPSVLEFTDAVTDISGATYLDPDTGTVRVRHTKLGTSPAAEGSVTLATLTFTAIGEGSSTVSADELTMTGTDLSTSEATGLGSTEIGVELLDAPVATTAPKILGTPRPGTTVTADGGSWDVPGVELSYQWKLNGRPIPGATGMTYRVPGYAAGKRLAVTVTALAPDHYPGTATSPSIKVRYLPVAITLGPTKAKPGKRPLIVANVIEPPFGFAKGSLAVTYDGRLIRRAVPIRHGFGAFRLPAKATGRHLLKVVFTPASGYGTATKRVWIRVKR